MKNICTSVPSLIRLKLPETSHGCNRCKLTLDQRHIHVLFFQVNSSRKWQVVGFYRPEAVKIENPTSFREWFISGVYQSKAFTMFLWVFQIADNTG